MRDAHRIREHSPWGERWQRVQPLAGWALGLVLVGWGARAGMNLVRDAAMADLPPKSPSIGASDAQAPASPNAANAAQAAPTTLTAADPGDASFMPSRPGAEIASRASDPTREAASPRVNAKSGRQPDGLLSHQSGTAKAGEYTAQLATFDVPEEARAFCRQLTRRGFHPHVACAQSSCAVRLGRFCERWQADEYRQRLARSDITARTVRVPSP